VVYSIFQNPATATPVWKLRMLNLFRFPRASVLLWRRLPHGALF